MNWTIDLGVILTTVITTALLGALGAIWVKATTAGARFWATFGTLRDGEEPRYVHGMHSFFAAATVAVFLCFGIIVYLVVLPKNPLIVAGQCVSGSCNIVGGTEIRTKINTDSFGQSTTIIYESLGLKKPPTVIATETGSANTFKTSVGTVTATSVDIVTSSIEGGKIVAPNKIERPFNFIIVSMEK